MAKLTHLERQRMMIVLLALFLLKYKHQKSAPQKTQVLNYISIHSLIRIRDDDTKTVATGEEAWANSLAWTRNRLRDESMLSMPDRGSWAITDHGIETTFKWIETAKIAMSRVEPSKLIETLTTAIGAEIIVTPDTFAKAAEAYEIYCERFPERRSELPNSWQLEDLF